MTENQEFVRVQLPSRGIFYGDSVSEGYVNLSPMTTNEEAMVQNPTADRLALLDSLLKSCLHLEKMDFKDLLVTDRLYLFLKLREITYGPEYEARFRCRRCSSVVVVPLMVPDGLNQRILTPEDKEPFELALPVRKKVLGLRLLRVRDEDEVQRYTKQRTARGVPESGDPSYVYRLSRHIVTIDGETVTPLAALNFCNNPPLVGRDSLALRAAIEDHDCGVDMMIDVTCNRCGEVFTDMLPFTAIEFFRPGFTARRLRGRVPDDIEEHPD